MKKKYGFLLAITMLFLLSCKEEQVEYQTNDCKGYPSFIKNFGFEPNNAAISTSEKRLPGLVLKKIKPDSDTQHVLYQHPTWKLAGNLGPFLIAPSGSVFVAPVPTVNILTNPTEKQNILYRVDAQTGVMSAFAKLPLPNKIPETNPYGILGLAYLCETNTIYISTVLGSERKHESGIIYALDANTGDIIDELKGYDIMGMGISYISGYRKLYMGSARSSDVVSITLDAKGKFSGSPRFELSISGLGERGDDKVRRIKFDSNGAMYIYSTEFNFNLSAPTEKKENVFLFNYDEATANWYNKINK